MSVAYAVLLIDSSPDVKTIFDFLQNSLNLPSINNLIPDKAKNDAVALYQDENFIVFDIEREFFRDSKTSAFDFVRDNIESEETRKKLFICLSELPDEFDRLLSSNLIHDSISSLCGLYVKDNVSSGTTMEHELKLYRTNKTEEKWIKYLTIFILSSFKSINRRGVQFSIMNFKQALSYFLERNTYGNPPENKIRTLSTDLFGFSKKNKNSLHSA